MAASTSESDVLSDFDIFESEKPEDSEVEDMTLPVTVSVPNLLARLKCPKSSDLSRKRKVQSNPPKNKKQCKGAVVDEPKSVAPSQRVKEFPSTLIWNSQMSV